MRVIGLDPGLGTTGYGILDWTAGQITVVDFGVIRPPAKKALSVRLNTLFTEIMALLKKYNPDQLAVEDTFYGKNVKTALLLGQARGVLLLAGEQQKLSCAEYSPRKIKQSAVGNGAATKEQVQFMIKSILKLRELPEPIDASDALAVALCHINQLSWQKK